MLAFLSSARPLPRVIHIIEAELRFRRSSKVNSESKRSGEALAFKPRSIRFSSFAGSRRGTFLIRGRLNGLINIDD